MDGKTNRKRIIQKVQTVRLSINDIVPDPNQPRKTFVSDGLSDLAQSLHETGQISPIVVRPESEGKYMIIVGERRWRAAQEAGVPDIECIVRYDVDDQGALEMQLAENSQREDIPPLEQAKALKNYLAKYKISQSELSRRTGIPQRTISDRLALLSLPASVHAKIESGEIGPYEGIKIASLSPENQEAIAEAVSSGRLSGRMLEKVANLLRAAPERQTQDVTDELISSEATSLSPARRAKPCHGDQVKTSEESSATTVSKLKNKDKSPTAPDEAEVFVFAPRKYEISSTLLAVAKYVCETEWHWPPLSVDDFLDTYLYESMRQRGVILGTYRKVEEHNEANK